MALVPMPYGFYTLLRLVVTIAAALVAYVWLRRDRSSLVPFAFGGVAFLFNPLIPVHLSRTAWAPIDVAVAAAFLLAMWREGKADLR
jgi:hypothetical protein